jgi:hypothetical protein
VLRESFHHRPTEKWQHGRFDAGIGQTVSVAGMILIDMYESICLHMSQQNAKISYNKRRKNRENEQ